MTGPGPMQSDGVTADSGADESASAGVLPCQCGPLAESDAQDSRELPDLVARAPHMSIMRQRQQKSLRHHDLLHQLQLGTADRNIAHCALRHSLAAMIVDHPVHADRLAFARAIVRGHMRPDHAAITLRLRMSIN
jgi:hypothetical protein